MRKTTLPFIRFMRYLAVLPLLLCLWGGCSMLKARFDPVGQQYAVTIKEEALALMDKAGESFSLYRLDVYRLMTRVERAYEHARLKYKNEGVAGIWDVMRSLEGNRLARFMLDWEKEDILDDTYIKEAKKLLTESFNLLIKIEESKEK